MYDSPMWLSAERIVEKSLETVIRMTVEEVVTGFCHTAVWSAEI